MIRKWRDTPFLIEGLDRFVEAYSGPNPNYKEARISCVSITAGCGILGRALIDREQKSKASKDILDTYSHRLPDDEAKTHLRIAVESALLGPKTITRHLLPGGEA